MATTVVDRFVTVLDYQSRFGNLRRYEAQTNRTVDRIAARVGTLGTAFSSVGKGLVGAGAVLTGGLAAVLGPAVGFEQALNRTAAVLQINVDEMVALETQARSLGATTSKTSTDAANAQYELAKAGFDMNQILALTPDVLNLAIAGELEMAESAGILAKQIKAFNLTADEAGRVTDVLAKAAASANTDIPGMAVAFRQVAPLAAAAGYSIEETAAVAARLQDIGLVPQQAGTAFRNLFLRFSKIDPPKAAVDAVERLGLDYGDLQDKVLGGDLLGAFEDLAAAGLDIKSAGGLFGPFAAVAGITIARDTDAIRELTGELYNAGGAADQMRETIESGLPGSLARFRSVVESVLLTISSAGLADRFAAFTEVVVQVIGRFNELPASVHELIGSLLLAGPAVLIFGGIVALLGTAMTALASPIGLIILALAAIAAGAVFLRKPLTDLWNRVSQYVTPAFAYFRAALDNLRATIEPLKTIWQSLKPVLFGLAVLVGGVLVAAIYMLGAALQTITWLLQKAVAFLAHYFEYASTVFGALWQFIQDVMSGMSLHDAGRKLMETLLDGIKSFAQPLIDGVTTIVGKVRDLLPFSDAKTGPLSDITKSGRALIDTFTMGIDSEASRLPAALRNAFHDLPALTAPLPVGPVPPPAGLGGDTVVTIDVGGITVTAPPGADAQEIADAVDGVLDDRLRRVAEQFKSRVRA